MSSESKLKEILNKVFSRGDPKPHIDERYVEISVPGFRNLVINLVPTGDSGNDIDFEIAGDEIYRAMQSLPARAYRIFRRNLVSELLSRTYTPEELRDLKRGIEEIGNEALRNKTPGSLLRGRDFQTSEMYEILDYIIEGRKD